MVLVCVGTPSNVHGALDDTHLLGVVAEIAQARHRLGRVLPIFIRSTALPDTHRRAIELVREHAPGQQPAYCVHPEFLRAGQAVADFHDPPKIVFGISDYRARAPAEHLYPGISAPTSFTDPMTASLVKYADNILHAVKVTYTNEVSMLAKSNGVDARQVLDLVCQDTKLNISTYYMRPGFAFGGSCLPKDLRAALAWARQNAVSIPMLEHVLTSNQLQIDMAVRRLLASEARSIGLLGLAFKPDTDDLRESPLVTMAETLHGKGRIVRIYDPALQIERMVGQNRRFALQLLPHLAEMMVESPSDLVSQADAVVVARRFPSLSLGALPWRPNQFVLDLDGRSEITVGPAELEGLYWDHPQPAL
jgi:GDP-mannose 6-dehydrogenase